MDTLPPFTKVRQRPDGKWEPADGDTATHYIPPPPPVVFVDPAGMDAALRIAAAIESGAGVCLAGCLYDPAAAERLGKTETVRIDYVSPDPQPL